MSRQLDPEFFAKIALDPETWAELVLIDPSTMKPFKANFVQKKLFKAVKYNKKTVIRVHRRAGKSYFLAVYALWYALVNRGSKVLIIAPDSDKVENIFKVIRNFINANPIIQEELLVNSKGDLEISFKSGGEIKCKTSASNSGNAASGLRGFGADLVILDETAYFREEDFDSINPIITGDQYRVDKIKTIASSTPTETQGTYWSWCFNKEMGWEEVWVPLSENPEYSEESKEDIRRQNTERQWLIEYEADFPDLGENVFRNSDIEYSRKDYRYTTTVTPQHNVTRTMGVDWDAVQAGVNIVVVEYNSANNIHRIIFREEVPRNEFIFTKAIERIVKLNEMFNPKWIYVDQGNGHFQVETLKQIGIKNRDTGLDKKIVGISFGGKTEVKDPVTGLTIKKQTKSVMLTYLIKLFEEGMIEISKYDETFKRQLNLYKILGVVGPDRSIKTSNKNEHIIDACSLACHALFINLTNKIKFVSTTRPILIETPKGKISRDTIKKDREVFKPLRQSFSDKSVYNTFGRGNFSSAPIKRSKV